MINFTITFSAPTQLVGYGEKWYLRDKTSHISHKTDSLPDNSEFCPPMFQVVSFVNPTPDI